MWLSDDAAYAKLLLLIYCGMKNYTIFSEELLKSKSISNIYAFLVYP